jgi:NAD(P)-dependent dehydrogenase (short-subunit alcohol dehydrogenase family)
MITFDGQVVIVTGAGRGMGRATALEFARRGARVLVNDYGGEPSTIHPGTSDVAQAVADEIVAAGGEAIADASSVGTGEAAGTIVDKAIKRWGRVDALVNNAGGTLIGALDEYSDAEIEGVLRTNFIGPYMLMRRCWPHFRAQNYGRVVNIMSSAMMGIGMIAPYSSGKSGLIGLTTDSAIEGKAFNALVNGILPSGHSRLTEKSAPAAAQWLAKYFHPELVAQATVYLCSSANTSVTGEMFSAGAGRVARDAIYNAEGYYDAELTVEKLAANIETARDMTGAVMITSSWEENSRYMKIAPWTGGEAGTFGEDQTWAEDHR